ncbi:MAG: FAD-dependent oxidoreductase [Candidatus Promineifilaceae bacterium]
MSKPVILAVDDEPQVLNAVERDLRQHYAEDYQILKARSGAEALSAVEEMKRRNRQVALFLADQRMPGMTGTEFLAQALRLYPDARKVLLTAYADTEAAIASINTIGLDHYLLKPWDPPDQRLYPVLDDLLDDWQAAVRPTFEGIRVAGTLWSPTSHLVKDFLARNLIPYQWLDLETDAEARELVERSVPEPHPLPVVFFPDGVALANPDLRTLAEKAGMRVHAQQEFYDLIIVGAGPAGLAAAVYGASEGLKTLLVDKEATGGQAGTSAKIENYLGFPRGLSGNELARRASAQASRLGAEILTATEVVRLKVDDPYRLAIFDDGAQLACKALVLATGVTTRKLDAPGVAGLTGAGVYYGAAFTEAAFYRGQHICVVGGANSAAQAAVYFSMYAARVTLLVRSTEIGAGMSHYLVNQIAATPNIEVLTRTSVVEAHGQDRLEALTVENLDDHVCRRIETPALFVFIGAVPHTELAAGLVARDAAGFILTGPDLFHNGRLPVGWKLSREPYLLETSVPGVFAAGDVRHGSVRRVASAVGQGANAISLVHQYLRTV